MVVLSSKVSHRGARGSAAILLAAAVALAAPHGAAAQAPDAATYKDRKLNCGTQSETGTKVCEMYQTIFTDQTRSEPALLVVVGYPQGSSDPGMLLVLPLGISLPSGVFLQIDQNEPQPIPVERCEADGCRIELLLPPDYLGALKAGSQATIYAHDRQRQRFALNFSLLGFTAALNALPAN